MKFQKKVRVWWRDFWYFVIVILFFALMGFLYAITSPPMWILDKLRRMIFAHSVRSIVRKGEAVPVEYLPDGRYWLLKKKSASEDQFFLFLDFFGGGDSIKVKAPKTMFDHVKVLPEPYDIIYECCENEVWWRYDGAEWCATRSDVDYSKFEEILIAKKVIRRILF